jgi:dTDP-4-dehydrorhamnose reductase
MASVTCDSFKKITVPILYNIRYQNDLICIVKTIGWLKKRISHHDRFKDRITASGSDPKMITEEEKEAPSEVKRPRRSAYDERSSFETESSVPPNYEKKKKRVL